MQPKLLLLPILKQGALNRLQHECQLMIHQYPSSGWIILQLGYWKEIPTFSTPNVRFSPDESVDEFQLGKSDGKSMDYTR